MCYRIISFGFLLICVQSINAEIPSYLKVCHKGPEFSACAVKSGNDALPHLLKGEKKMKIPNMLPMRFPEVDVDAGPTLKIKLFDLDVFGLDTVVLKNVKIDFDKLHVTLFMNAKRAALIGKYEVDGQILVLPIQGNGNLNITIENSDFQYDFNYKLVKKNDVDYAQVLPEDTLEFQIPMAYIQLDNLFNGNKQLGDHVNKFLNENHQDAIKEMSGAIKVTISAIGRQFFQGIFDSIPYKDLFLD
ncbi:protein takeout-like [Sitophilus oryzae]|uniref:Protein takeout-like n=1 Tax=Sitophilus oryzae TaxID=7048 RepID=A0A6J2XN47_SITOR|nr:protein takeout-like [Sitophilus oryzae]